MSSWQRLPFLNRSIVVGCDDFEPQEATRNVVTEARKNVVTLAAAVTRRRISLTFASPRKLGETCHHVMD